MDYFCFLIYNFFPREYTPVAISIVESEKHKMANFDEIATELRNRFLVGQEPILLVGEGNFTFSTALAAMRRSWFGIISTKLDIENFPTINDVKLDALTAVMNYNNDNDRLGKMIKLLILPNSEIGAWISGIDATRDLDQFKNLQNIWFQCPWRAGDPNNLLTEFVTHCAAFQTPGNLLFIGIVYKDPLKYKYLFGKVEKETPCTEYQLNNFLGLSDEQLDNLLGGNGITNVDNSIISINHYELLYFGDRLILDILSHGYRHHSDVYDIHRSILKFHKTIVLRKKENAELSVQQMTEQIENLCFSKADETKVNTAPTSASNSPESINEKQKAESADSLHDEQTFFYEFNTFP